MTQYYVFTDLNTGYVTSCTVTDEDKKYSILPLVAHSNATATEYESFIVEKAYEGYEYTLEMV